MEVTDCDLQSSGQDGLAPTAVRIYRAGRGYVIERAAQVFGEPLFHLPALKLLVYQAIVSPLVVHYALHQARPLVIVRSVELLG